MELSISMLLIALPLLLVLFLKTNAGMMFFATCSGLVLLSSVDPTVVVTAGAVVPGEGEEYVRLAVVALSVIFGAVAFRRTVGGLELLLHGCIAILLGVMLWLLLPDAVGVSWLTQGVTNDLWRQLFNYRTLIIAAIFALSVIALLFGKPINSHKKSDH